MAKGILKIVNTYNGIEMGIIASEDIGKTIEDFNNGIMPVHRLQRYHHKDSLKIVIIEETENLAQCFASYKFPQIDRVVYSEECINMSVEKKFDTKIRNVIDWLIETFADKKYSFKITVDDEGEIVAFIFENGLVFEKYVFKGRCKGPWLRGSIC